MYTDMVGVVHIHADILDSPLFLFMLIDQVNISNYFSLLGYGCFKKKNIRFPSVIMSQEVPCYLMASFVFLCR